MQSRTRKGSMRYGPQVQRLACTLPGSAKLSKVLICRVLGGKVRYTDEVNPDPEVLCLCYTSFTPVV